MVVISILKIHTHNTHMWGRGKYVCVVWVCFWRSEVSQRSIPAVFLYSDPPEYLKGGFSLNLELTTSASVALERAPWIYLCYSTMVPDAHLLFMGSGTPISGPHAYVVNTCPLSHLSSSRKMLLILSYKAQYCARYFSAGHL